MDFAESPEHEMLRDAVARHRQRASATSTSRGARAADERTDELWQAARRARVLRACTCPRSAAAAAAASPSSRSCCEELAAQGCPLLLMLVSPGDLRRADRAVRHRRAEARVAAARSSRARRWCSRSPSPTPVRTATTSPPPRRATATCTASTAARPTSRASTRRGAILVVARTGVDESTGNAAARRCSSSTPTRPGSSARTSRWRSRSPEKQFQLVLRRRRGAGATGCSATRARACARCSSGSTPSGSSARRLAVGVGRYALERAASYARDREVWGVPIGTPPGHRAPAGRWPRSSSSWPGS